MKILSTSLLSFVSALFLSSYWEAPSNSSEDLVQCLTSNPESNSINNTIYTPNNSSYMPILMSRVQNLRTLSTSAFEPLLIVTPLHEFDVQSVIICSKRHGIEMRVRSGGHDYEGLSYTSQSPFILLDMKNFRSITIDVQSNTAWAGVGATLGELYYTIAQTSTTLAFPAGVCPTVGLGGHISGGGFGMISRRHGLAIDHVVDARLVDANGTILDRTSMGEDLFWAIRGGGASSFGVILDWKIELVHVPEQVTVFDVSRNLNQDVTSLVHKWQHIADKIDENLVMRLFISSPTSSRVGERTIRVSFTALFLGGVDTLVPIMDESFPELGLRRQDCVEMSWIESAVFIEKFPKGTTPQVLLNRTNTQRGYFKGKSDFVKEPISEYGLTRIWEKLYEEMGHAEIQFTPYGGKMNDYSEYELPFPHRSGNIYMIQYVVIWDDKEDVATVQRRTNWITSIYNLMEEFVSKSPRSAYFNYRDFDIGVNRKGNNPSYATSSIWGNKYFKNNFNRLVYVKTKVDPDNFFRNEQTIPPLLLG